MFKVVFIKILSVPRQTDKILRKSLSVTIAIHILFSLSVITHNKETDFDNVGYNIKLIIP